MEHKERMKQLMDDFSANFFFWIENQDVKPYEAIAVLEYAKSAVFKTMWENPKK